MIRALFSRLYQIVFQRYLLHQWHELRPYLLSTKTILDFGCGDMKFARYSARRLPHTHITGVDVVDIQMKKSKRTNYIRYDGHVIPTKNAMYDIVMAYHVLHHCSYPFATLKECIRVSKGRVLIIEPVLTTIWEKPAMMLMDVLANSGGISISMPFHFYTKIQWHTMFKKASMRVVEERNIGMFPDWLPIGKTTLFFIERIETRVH